MADSTNPYLAPASLHHELREVDPWPKWGIASLITALITFLAYGVIFGAPLQQDVTADGLFLAISMNMIGVGLAICAGRVERRFVSLAMLSCLLNVAPIVFFVFSTLPKKTSASLWLGS